MDRSNALRLVLLAFVIGCSVGQPVAGSATSAGLGLQTGVDPDLVNLNVSGPGVMCTTQKGICFLSDNGSFTNLTKQKIVYPLMSSGAAYVYEGHYKVILH